MLLTSIKRLDGKEVTQSKLDNLYNDSNFVMYLRGKGNSHHFVFLNNVQIEVFCEGRISKRRMDYV